MVKKSNEKHWPPIKTVINRAKTLSPSLITRGAEWSFRCFYWLNIWYVNLDIDMVAGNRKYMVYIWMEGEKLLVLLLLASFRRYWQKCIRELENAAQRYLFGSAFITQQLSFFTCPLLARVCHSYNKELRDARKFFAPVHCSVGNSAWIFFDFGDKFPSWSRTLKFFLDMSKNLS